MIKDHESSLGNTTNKERNEWGNLSAVAVVAIPRLLPKMDSFLLYAGEENKKWILFYKEDVNFWFS